MIILESVSKKYHNSFVLDNISFSVKKGTICGLIGHNGAGKTTIIRLISALIKPASGRILLDGLSVSDYPYETKKKLGVLLGGDVTLYSELTAKENIEYYARLRGLEPKQIGERLSFLNDYLHFETFLNRRAVGFSRGMRQKVALAKALIHNPDIFILDEPTTGLDIGTTLEIHELIMQLKKEQKTILITTHDLYEIETLFDHLFIIKKGRLIENGLNSQMLTQDRNLMKQLYQLLGEE